MEETPNPKINLIVSTETSIKQKQMGLVEVPKVTILERIYSLEKYL